MLERDFYTFIKNVSFPSPTGVGSHNSEVNVSDVKQTVTNRSNLLWIWEIIVDFFVEYVENNI